jgi:hypothetical protein
LKGASASSDTSNPAFRKTYELMGAESYSLVATGLLTSQGFAANPDGIGTGFDITVMPGARVVSSTSAGSDNADVRVLHAVTDAPFVDVRVQSGPTLVNNAGFRDFTPYLSAPNVDLTLEVSDSAQSVVVARFLAPLSAFADSALLVMASGFFIPTANQNGPAFGLLAVTASGNAVLLPVVSSAKGVKNSQNLKLYPNPSKGMFAIKLPQNTEVKEVRLVSTLGRSEIVSFTSDENQVNIKTELTSGVYRVEVVGRDNSVLRSSLVLQ